MLGAEFRFALGSIVHFGRGGRYYEVAWRGWLVVGEVGRRHRIDVYWLAGGACDCYYGDELWSIGQYSF